jgi:hypothetical protein
VTVKAADWLEILLAQAQEAETGIVSTRLMSVENDEESKTLPDLTDDSPEYYYNFVQQCSVHMNGLQCPQNVLAVSWELCMVSKERFVACPGAKPGFDDINMPVLFWSLDFCLRLFEQGYENVYLPCDIARKQVRGDIVFGQGKSDALVREKKFFQARWQKRLLKGDPYYNLGVLEAKRISTDEFLQWYAGL